VGDLLKEHGHLGDLTRKLAAALKNIAQDSEIPRDWFESIVEEYLTSNEKHIAGEERIFFPRAAATLTPEDWHAIDAAAGGKDDPLFGGKVAKDYRALYERIMRLSV
jgi:hemerythrin-like domain-containing protein